MSVKCSGCSWPFLKLSEGQQVRLPDLLRAAKHDYRDVLMWAEYPKEGAALWALRPRLSDEDRSRIAEIRRRDRSQHVDWLKGVKRRPTRG